MQTKIKYPQITQITQISILGSDAAQGYRKRDRARKMFLLKSRIQAPEEICLICVNLRISNLCSAMFIRVYSRAFAVDFICLNQCPFHPGEFRGCGWSVFFACIRGLHLL